MKKAGFLIVLIAVFGMCLWLGYRATAGGMLPGIAPGAQEAQPTATTQRNILIASVDSLETSTPQLISVWVLFAVPSNPSPSILFLPVYFADGSKPDAAYLGGAFALDDSGRPAPAFTEAVRARLNLDRLDNYVTIDRDGVAIFAALFPGAQPSLQPFEVVVPDDIQAARVFCAGLQSKPSGMQVQVDWTRIAPAHFRTGLNLTEFSTTWQAFTQPDTNPHCEVLP